MEPDYERPNTVSGLKAKHAELTRLRDRHQAEAERLTRGLAALETAITLFEPDADMRELRDAVTPTRAKRGAIRGFVLDTLRESAAPMTARELAERLAAHQGLEGTPAQIASLRQRVRSTVKDAAGRGVLECVGKTDGEQPGGAAKLWAVTQDG